MAASKIKVRKAFGIGLEKPFYCKLLYPSSVGCLTAAALAMSPTVVDKAEPILEMLPSAVTKIPTPVILAAVGFPAGYLLTAAANWARWKTIKALLQYQGWIHGTKNMKTKVKYVDISIEMSVKLLSQIVIKRRRCFGNIKPSDPFK